MVMVLSWMVLPVEMKPRTTKASPLGGDHTVLPVAITPLESFMMTEASP